jgi:hypothetical protein
MRIWPKKMSMKGVKKATVQDQRMRRPRPEAQKRLERCKILGGRGRREVCGKTSSFGLVVPSLVFPGSEDTGMYSWP